MLYGYSGRLSPPGDSTALTNRHNPLFLLALLSWHEACTSKACKMGNKRMNMNKRLIAAVMATGALALGACSTTPTNAQVGATAGAVVGGVVGSALTGSTAGTVVGAGAGAAVGHEIGKRIK
jgi:osmotically inducible lipoprotein OsmB